MKFEDLTPYDIMMIKSHASSKLSNTKCNCRYEALSEEVLACIYANGFKIEPYPDKLSLVIAKEIQPQYLGRGTSQASYPADDVIKEIFEFIKKSNLNIIKDETRESTWSRPRASWYTPYDNRKKSWQW